MRHAVAHRAVAAVCAASVLAASACAGEDDKPAKPAGESRTATKAGVAEGAAPCQKDLATAYKRASDAAFPVLRDYVPAMLERYEELVAADARPDQARFKAAYDRFFRTPSARLEAASGSSR